VTAGERWTREEIARLRARRFSPLALLRFLRVTLGRAGETRRARPALTRQARRWGWVGAGAWGLVAVVPHGPGARAWRSGALWWASVVVMVDWHLGMVETEAGEPRLLGPADALTLARAWLVPLALDAPTPLVCLLAAGTDALDGPLARRSAPTRAGRDLEGVVDVAFALAALEGTRRRGWLGPRVVALERTRLSAGVLYTLLAYFGAIRRPADAVIRAGRVSAGLRVGALVLASRRPALASGLLLAGSAAAVAALPGLPQGVGTALARAARRTDAVGRARPRRLRRR